MGINRVVLSGNLTREPELRTTQTGTVVLSMGIAVNDRRRNQQTGEWEDFTTFIDCAMFGNRAQAVAQYLSKGQRVMLEGKLRYSTWEKDGQKHSKIDVIVNDIDFTSSRNSGQGYGGQGYGGGQNYGGNQNSDSQSLGQSAYSAPTTPVVDTSTSVYDEDIPF